MKNITLTGFQLGFVCNLLKGNNDFFPLYHRIRAAASNARPDDDAPLTVAVTEGEIVNAIMSVSRAPQGIAKPVAIAMRDSLGAQIMAGLAEEGPGEEPILDGSGNPVMQPTSAENPTPILVTRPKFWARILTSLTAIEDQELAQRIRMANDGWN